MSKKHPQQTAINDYEANRGGSPSRYQTASITHRGGIFSTATNIATNFQAIMNAENQSFPYRKCILRDRDGDLSKRWYIEFYVWDIAKTKLVRKVDYGEINKFDTARERKKAAKLIIREIDKLLISGKVIDSGNPVEIAPKSNPKIITGNSPFIHAYKFASAHKIENCRKRTASTYISYDNVLCEIFADLQITKLPLAHITPNIMHQVMDALKLRRQPNGRKISNRTYNNYLYYLTSHFNTYIRREVIAKNPCKSIRKLEEGTGRNIAYSDKQKSILLQAFHCNEDKQLALFCTFIYYTLARPNELRQMQVKHLETQTIYIPKGVSKNRNDRAPIIAEQIERIIEKEGWRKYPQNYYVFGQNGVPGPEPYSVSYFGNKHRKYILDLGFGSDYSMYSWKHSGTVDAFLAGIDIRRLQQQIGHASIAQTMTYLKSLNLLNDKDLSQRFPDLPPLSSQ